MRFPFLYFFALLCLNLLEYALLLAFFQYVSGEYEVLFWCKPTLKGFLKKWFDLK